MIDPEYLDKLNARLSELETEMSQPEIHSDQKRYREVMLQYSHAKRLREKAATYFSIKNDLAENEGSLSDANDDEFQEMVEAELESLRAAFPAAEQDLRIALLPPDPLDNANILVEIRAGTGGDEAGLFAGDLLRMYQRFAEIQGWKAEIVEGHSSEMGGYKEATLAVSGDAVYRHLRYESGVHRVQRVPATEASGRIHTSAATVAVLPEAEDVEIEIKTEDLTIETTRASGAGGQHVNTTDSAIRIVHEPTGVVVQCQDERSQHKNRDKAMRVLRARLLDLKQQEEADKRSDARKSMVGSGDRSERIRTYNFPQNRVTDHRINLTLYALDRIVEGDLSELVNALYTHDVEERLQEQLDKA